MNTEAIAEAVRSALKEIVSSDEIDRLLVEAAYDMIRESKISLDLCDGVLAIFLANRLSLAPIEIPIEVWSDDVSPETLNALEAFITKARAELAAAE